MYKKQKENIILYFQQYEAIRHLSAENKGLLLDAIFHYAMTNKIEDNLPPLVEMAFSFIRTAMDIDTAKYEKKCQENKKNAYVRWNTNYANASEHTQMDANNANTNNQVPLQNDHNQQQSISTVDELLNSLPKDEIRRNSQGLIKRLKRYKLSESEICKIMQLSDYGAIGNKVWNLCDILSDTSSIHWPYKFLLSKLTSQ